MPSFKSIKISYFSPPLPPVAPPPHCEEPGPPPPPSPPPPPPPPRPPPCSSPCHKHHNHPPPPGSAPPPPTPPSPPPPPIAIASPPPPPPNVSSSPPPRMPPPKVAPARPTSPPPGYQSTAPPPYFFAESPLSPLSIAPSPPPLAHGGGGGGNKIPLEVGTSLGGLFFLSFLALGLKYFLTSKSVLPGTTDTTGLPTSGGGDGPTQHRGKTGKRAHAPQPSHVSMDPPPSQAKATPTPTTSTTTPPPSATATATATSEIKQPLQSDSAPTPSNNGGPTEPHDPKPSNNEGPSEPHDPGNEEPQDEESEKNNKKKKVKADTVIKRLEKTQELLRNLLALASNNNPQHPTSSVLNIKPKLKVDNQDGDHKPDDDALNTKLEPEPEDNEHDAHNMPEVDIQDEDIHEHDDDALNTKLEPGQDIQDEENERDALNTKSEPKVDSQDEDTEVHQSKDNKYNVLKTSGSAVDNARTSNEGNKVVRPKPPSNRKHEQRPDVNNLNKHVKLVNQIDQKLQPFTAQSDLKGESVDKMAVGDDMENSKPADIDDKSNLQGMSEDNLDGPQIETNVDEECNDEVTKPETEQEEVEDTNRDALNINPEPEVDDQDEDNGRDALDILQKPGMDNQDKDTDVHQSKKNEFNALKTSSYAVENARTKYKGNKVEGRQPPSYRKQEQRPGVNNLNTHVKLVKQIDQALQPGSVQSYLRGESDEKMAVGEGVVEDIKPDDDDGDSSNLQDTDGAQVEVNEDEEAGDEVVESVPPDEDNKILESEKTFSEIDEAKAKENDALKMSKFVSGGERRIMKNPPSKDKAKKQDGNATARANRQTKTSNLQHFNKNAQQLQQGFETQSDLKRINVENVASEMAAGEGITEDSKPGDVDDNSNLQDAGEDDQIEVKEEDEGDDEVTGPELADDNKDGDDKILESEKTEIDEAKAKEDDGLGMSRQSVSDGKRLIMNNPLRKDQTKKQARGNARPNKQIKASSNSQHVKKNAQQLQQGFDKMQSDPKPASDENVGGEMEQDQKASDSNLEDGNEGLEELEEEEEEEEEEETPELEDNGANASEKTMNIPTITKPRKKTSSKPRTNQAQAAPAQKLINSSLKDLNKSNDERQNVGSAPDDNRNDADKKDEDEDEDEDDNDDEDEDENEDDASVEDGSSVFELGEVEIDPTAILRLFNWSSEVERLVKENTELLKKLQRQIGKRDNGRGKRGEEHKRRRVGADKNAVNQDKDILAQLQQSKAALTVDDAAAAEDQETATTGEGQVPQISI